MGRRGRVEAEAVARGRAARRRRLARGESDRVHVVVRVVGARARGRRRARARGRLRLALALGLVVFWLLRFARGVVALLLAGVVVSDVADLQAGMYTTDTNLAPALARLRPLLASLTAAKS